MEKISFFVSPGKYSSEKQYLLVQDQNNSVHNISALADSFSSGKDSFGKIIVILLQADV
jgi:hypothetical protein